MGKSRKDVLQTFFYGFGTAGKIDDEAPAPAPAHVKENPVKKPKKEPEMTVQEVKEVVEIKQQTTLAKPKTGEAMFHSDTVNNVMDIFEGKFIE